jgi:hypothetical protein
MPFLKQHNSAGYKKVGYLALCKLLSCVDVAFPNISNYDFFPPFFLLPYGKAYLVVGTRIRREQRKGNHKTYPTS